MRLRTLERATLAAGLVLSALALGCSQGSSPQEQSVEGIASNPAITDGFDKFMLESNLGGGASEMKILAMYYGRLVDVYDCKSCGTPTEKRRPLFRDLLIDAEIQSDGVTYELEVNPVTARQELTILHTYDPTPGSAFKNALDKLEAGLDKVQPKGIAINVLPPFAVVPRNGAVAIRFDDLLDPASVDDQTVKLRVGYPPEAPYESRVVPDRNHGAIAQGGFRSTRVIIDFSVSKQESLATGVPENLVGLPGAVNTTQPNIGVIIPTKISAPQFLRLENLSGQPVAFTGNGPTNTGSPTDDVVRGFRSGGRGNVTLDPYDGFLPDDTPPQLLGSQPVTIFNIAPLGGGEFSFDMTFSQASCAVTPRVGDLVDLATADLRVTMDGPPPTGATVTGVLATRIDDVSPNAPSFGVGAAEYKFAWDTTLGLPPECFLRFSPSSAAGPTLDIQPDATVRLSFSEPMNPDTVDPLESFTISDPTQAAGSLNDIVVATMFSADNQTSFTLVPSLPLNHAQGTAETYNVDLTSGFDPQTQTSFGLTDLAGNHIPDLPPQIPFTLDSAASGGTTGNIALRFDAVDEDGNGSPEVRGQLVYDLARGLVQPRGVSRFDAFMDSTSLSAPTVANMVPIVGGVVEPLSIFGSRTMTVWRYFDLGMPFFDDAFFNLDVEGLYWMVDAGQTGVKIDFFPEFQLLTSHSKYLPDEYREPQMMGPPILLYPTSGLTTTFSDNILDPVNDPQTVLAPKDVGYLINPNESFTPPLRTGIVMVPLPFNPAGTPISEFDHWTWRDTSILSQAGPFGGGADTLGNPDPNGDSFYQTGQVPTIGLPMLLDFRTYPAPTGANGTNFLALAGVNFASGENLPFYRIHSTGGIDASNTNQILIDPDTETTAQGGWTALGTQTPGIDSGFYYGGASFVTRVNRIHTVWFDAGVPSSFAPLVTRPAVNDVPAGTQMSFAFRGATQLSSLTAASNGNNIDPYGDSFQTSAGGTPFSVTFLNGDTTWKSTLAEVNGSRYVQVRVTMISNDLTGVVPELSSLGISFFN